MKKVVGITLFVFWSLVTATLAGGFIAYEGSKNQKQAEAAPNNLPLGTELNMTEIAKHNSAADCWLLIDSKVYNVTDSISSHPGGRNEILA